MTLGEQECTVDLENLTVQFDQNQDKQIPLKIFQLVAPADLPEHCRSSIARALENNFYVNVHFLLRHVKLCSRLSEDPDPVITELSLNSGPTGSSGEAVHPVDGDVRRSGRKRSRPDLFRSAFR